MGFQGREAGGRGINSDAEEGGGLSEGTGNRGGKEERGSRGQKAGKSWTATQTHSSDGGAGLFPTVPSAASQEGSANGGAVLRNPVPRTRTSFSFSISC